MTDRWNPLFSSFIKSSVLKEGPVVVAVWAMLLSDADRYGESDLSVPFIAERLRISQDDVRGAFLILSSPDPDSGSKEHEGRRIEWNDGKWFLLTHSKYREKASRERALATARKRKQRERERINENAAPPQENSLTPTQEIAEDDDDEF
jgi:hypothetical protein